MMAEMRGGYVDMDEKDGEEDGSCVYLHETRVLVDMVVY
jgi:hypothetical protein